MKYRSAGNRPQNLSRRLANLLPVALLAPAMLISGSTPPAAAAPPTVPVIGPACPDVMVIAARGSGEQPQPNGPHGDWLAPAAYTFADTDYGAGGVNYDVYASLEVAAPRLHFSLDPVQYPADQAWEAVTGTFAFLASEKSAVPTILDDVNRTERTCGGGVKYVFTGYSQGAWAVHEALWQLARSEPSILGRVVGVSLFGDPEFVPNQKINQGPQKDLKKFGIAEPANQANNNVPQSLQNATASYCLYGDPICQGWSRQSVLSFPDFIYCQGVGWAQGLCPHTSYIQRGDIDLAATLLVRHLPTTSAWPYLTLTTPPVGTLGTGYSWQATATSTKPTSYTWSTQSPFYLPPGLALSSSGVLSGTPTRTGTYGFDVSVITSQGRRSSDMVSVTIKPGSSPPVASGALFLEAGTTQEALPGPIKAGAKVSIRATGDLFYGYEGAAGCVGYPQTDPDGNRTLNGVPCDPKLKRDPLTPLPTAPVGALIARMGSTGPWYLIGSSGSISATKSGTLYIAYNDEIRSDDRDGYSVKYTIT